MTKSFSNLYNNNDPNKELKHPTLDKTHFTLAYKNLVIGFLSYDKGVWHFTYSEEFKKQNKICALTDFPQKEKQYEDRQLWPFFSLRIPGLGQPKVKEILKRENIDPKNSCDLLLRFGERTISNPFILTGV